MDPGSTEQFDASLWRGEDTPSASVCEANTTADTSALLCVNGSDLQQQTEVAVTPVEVVLS